MRKHLIAFAAFAFVTLGVRAVGTDGDIASIEAVPNNETGVAYDPYIGNRETPHKVGETFYVLVRLLNQNWADMSKNHPWQFVQSASGVLLGDYSATVYWPQLGLAIGNKKIYADFSTTGPNGEISGPNDQVSYYTDLYFKYTVKEGELGLPIHFLNQSQQIIDSGAGSTGFCFMNVNSTGTGSGGYWNLSNDIADSTA